MVGVLIMYAVYNTAKEQFVTERGPCYSRTQAWANYEQAREKMESKHEDEQPYLKVVKLQDC